MQEAWGLGRPAGARKGLHLEGGGTGSGGLSAGPPHPHKPAFRAPLSPHTLP